MSRKENQMSQISEHDKLLKLIKSRSSKQSEFSTGISTGDRFAKTLQQCVGSDLCYRYGANGNVSFDDAVKRAGNVLTYNNADMEVDDIYVDFKSRFEKDTEIELPKNTLMVFKHVLTTPRKDRDGDILRTQGAKPDPKMLLLWQHVHTLPIGKAIRVVEHTSKTLNMLTAIVDINELAQDAAVMVDNGMGRFSHGFRALSFSDMKAEVGDTTGKGGFDVKSFEIMEESLVSVPSNPDAETTEVMLDLIEGDKLTSSMMKAFGKKLRTDSKTTTVAGGLPDHLVGDKHAGTEKGADGHDCGCGKKPAECGCGKKPPEKADDGGSEESAGSEKAAKNEKMTCPNCDEGVIEADGTCPECGWNKGEPSEKDTDENSAESDMGADLKDKPKPKKPVAKDFTGEKAGKVLSNSNYSKLTEVHEGLKELDAHCSTRTGKALCKTCMMGVKEVLDGQKLDDMEVDDEKAVELNAKNAAALFIQKSTPEEREHLLGVLKALDTIEKQTRMTNQFRKMVTSN